MSAETTPIIKLGVPKGSLEEATINLFERAGWKIRKHTRNYFPDINDPEIAASLCRVQEIGSYVAAGVLDAGITGLDWLVEREHEDKVVRVADLVYSKTSNRPCRWVLAVAGDSPYQKPQDLAGKRIATEVEGLTRRYFTKAGVDVEVFYSWGATEAKVVAMLHEKGIEKAALWRSPKPAPPSAPTACASLMKSCAPTPCSSSTRTPGRTRASAPRWSSSTCCCRALCGPKTLWPSK